MSKLFSASGFTLNDKVSTKLNGDIQIRCQSFMYRGVWLIRTIGVIRTTF